MILVVLTAALSEIPFLPELILKPQFGHNSCVFDGKNALRKIWKNNGNDLKQ